MRSNIYRSAADLFADMPLAAFPRGGKDGTPERSAATGWMEKHRVGPQHQLDWTATITEVEIDGCGDRFHVLLKEEGDYDEGRSSSDVLRWHLVWPEPFLFEGICCGTAIAYPSYHYFRGGFGPVTSKMAKQLRELKGKAVTHRAPIIRAEFNLWPSPFCGRDYGCPVWCILVVAQATINGCDPRLAE